jgi:peptide/nickel transport system permease protein
MPITLLLTFYSLVISICISAPLGIYSAIKKGSTIDKLTRIVSLIGLAFPNMWIALIILLGLLLLFGWSPPVIYSSPVSDIWLHIQIIIWPSIILGWEQSSHMIRVVRSNMIEVLSKDYIVTARSRGLSEISIIIKHAVPNVLLSTLTMAGLQIGSLITGVVVLETIFGLPGLGSGLIQAALVRDYPVIQSTVTMMILLSLSINLFIDLIYNKIDPRL